MTWRYAALALLLVSFVATRHILAAALSPMYRHIATSLTAPINDPESILAIGDMIPLQCADVASLELISGVSDSLALELINKRAAILSAARTLTTDEALQLAHGVGENTAKRLATLISLPPDSPCLDSPYLFQRGETGPMPRTIHEHTRRTR